MNARNSSGELLPRRVHAPKLAISPKATNAFTLLALIFGFDSKNPRSSGYRPIMTASQNRKAPPVPFFLGKAAPQLSLTTQICFVFYGSILRFQKAIKPGVGYARFSLSNRPIGGTGIRPLADLARWSASDRFGTAPDQD